MKIVLFTQYFPPEVGATQTRMDVFARHLAGAGHQVTVITELPNHPVGRIFDGWRGRLVSRRREHGYDVIRVWVAASPRKSFWRRIAFYASYAVAAVVAALVVHRQRPDVVLATSPPLPVAFSAMVAARIWRRPLVADIRDIWPAVGVALGELQPGRAYRLAEALERAVYRDAETVTCVTRGFVAHIQERVDRPEKVELIPNGTLPDLFRPAARDETLADELGLRDAFVIGYIGLHGIAQGLPTLLDAADAMRDDSNLGFLFVGEGPVKEALVADAATRRLPNVVFHDQVRLDEVVGFVNVCDVLVVPLRRLEVLSTFIPSKMFDFMACGRPVVLMVDGEAREIVERAGAGLFVEPEDVDGLVAALRRLRSDEATRAAMAAAGRSFVEAHYDREVQSARMAQVLERAVAASRSRRAGRGRPRPGCSPGPDG